MHISGVVFGLLVAVGAFTRAENATTTNMSSTIAYLPPIFSTAADTNWTTSDNATWASEALLKACKGAGTDEQMIIDVLGPMEPQTRYRVATRFRELYNQTLKSVLRSDTSGWFRDLLSKIGVPLPELEHDIIWQVYKSYDEENHVYQKQKALVPLFVGRSPDEIQKLKDVYEQLENRDFLDTVKRMLLPQIKLILLPWIENTIPQFDATQHTLEKAEQDVKALYKAGKGKSGTDEDAFVEVIAQSPREHLQNISMIYEREYGQSLVNAINDEFSGPLKTAILQHVRFMLEAPVDVLAHMFFDAMDGGGTVEVNVNNGLVRYFRLLPEINDAYRRQYGESLRERIQDETSGYYRKLLLRIFDFAIPYTPPPPKSHRTLNIVLISVGSSLVVIAAISRTLIVLKKRQSCCWRVRTTAPQQEATVAEYKAMADATSGTVTVKGFATKSTFA